MERQQNALQALIAQHCEDTGDRLSDVADRGGMSRQTLSAVVHKDRPNGIPRPATLKRLAVGLQVDLAVVERAAALAASSGQLENADVDARLSALVAQARRLNDDHVRALTVMARALARVE